MTVVADHAPTAVRAEFEGWDKVPASWVRMARRGCPDCARWDATRARMRTLHTSYRRRTNRCRPS